MNHRIQIPRASVEGQLLVATPQIHEPLFTRTVIYVLSHSDKGAEGLVVNRYLGSGSVRDILSGLGVKTVSKQRIGLFMGGPVDPSRGAVLHSSDYAGTRTRRLSDKLALSVDLDIIKAVADGRGPRRKLLLLGHAGWAPGQLEAEIARRDWLIAPADLDLIFSESPGATWEKALKRILIAL